MDPLRFIWNEHRNHLIEFIVSIKQCIDHLKFEATASMHVQYFQDFLSNKRKNLIVFFWRVATFVVHYGKLTSIFGLLELFITACTRL